jgi:hypothetical protein
VVILTSVDATEGHSDESVRGVRDERGGDPVGELDGLGLDGGASDGYSVGTNDTAGSGSIGVFNAPGVSGESLVCGALG